MAYTLMSTMDSCPYAVYRHLQGSPCLDSCMSTGGKQTVREINLNINCPCSCSCSCYPSILISRIQTREISASTKLLKFQPTLCLLCPPPETSIIHHETP